MKTRIIAPLAAAAFALSMTACASDEVPDEDPAVVVDDNDVPIDPSVEPGVDTNVETEENLGFEGDET